MSVQPKSTVIEFKGRTTLDVSYDIDDVESTDFFPGELLEVKIIPTNFQDRVNIKFYNGCAFNVSKKLFREIEDD